MNEPRVRTDMSIAEVPPTIAGWTLKKLLGSGGFATVWLAERLEDGARAAIKVLRPEHEGKFLLHAEWDALSRMRHPGVVTGRSGDGQHIVMDYVEGPTLADDLRAQKLWTLGETVEILGHLCDALGAVHRAGLVHHDVNPNNVILQGQRPVLIDFGCVTVSGLHHPNKDRHPQWLSPEAVQREPASVTDDLWPVPLLALAMLTGLGPNGGDPMEVWLMLSVYDGFEDPPDDPNLPPGFSRWWRKATHPDPTKRYRSAATLKQSLLRLGRNGG